MYLRMHCMQIIILTGWTRHHQFATAQNSSPTTNNSQLLSSAFNQCCSLSSGRKAPANKKEQLNKFPSNNNDEEFPPFDGQTAVLNIEDNRLESDKEEEQPDESMLHLYEEFFDTIESAWP